MTIKPLGDSAWLIEWSRGVPLDEILAWVAALKENQPPGVLDVLSSYASVAVHFSGVDGLEILNWIQQITVNPRPLIAHEVEIPVIYGGEDGPDLETVAEHTGKSVSEVIVEHSQVIYTVTALGFSPGFPYLTGLPASLQLPRHRTPRVTVPAGSVAIAGKQAGIYPTASPAGWHILGRTDVVLFDPAATPPTLLKAGDRVRFVPTWTALQRQSRSSALDISKPDATRGIEVIQPGGLTTVQDLGRPGHEAMGVSPGGAVDRWALQVANAMVGNPVNAAALECCVSGPVLKFHHATTVALMGASGKSRRVAAGEVVDFSKLEHGVRAYLAFAGGLQVLQVMGSASTDLRAGFGGFMGRALKKGDRLECNEVSRSPHPGNWSVGRQESRAFVILRYIAGVQTSWFSSEALRRFRTEIFQVSPLADRMGTRLSGPMLERVDSREMVSQPVAWGSVQVPPDGQPIVLMAERQTMGGYPQIGHVISADLPKLARAWPGTKVKFEQVSWEEAVSLRQQSERDFVRLQSGLELLK
jgi:KipI family sensor histidine kinase inhibitor